MKFFLTLRIEPIPSKTGIVYAYYQINPKPNLKAIFIDQIKKERILGLVLRACLLKV